VYNSALSLTSIGAKIDDRITGTRTFRIHGEMYHSIRNLLSNDEEYPQLAQIYILNIMLNLDPNILIKLRQILNEVNPYVKIFYQASGMRTNQ